MTVFFKLFTLYFFSRPLQQYYLYTLYHFFLSNFSSLPIPLFFFLFLSFSSLSSHKRILNPLFLSNRTSIINSRRTTTSTIEKETLGQSSRAFDAQLGHGGRLVAMQMQNCNRKNSLKTERAKRGREGVRKKEKYRGENEKKGTGTVIMRTVRSTYVTYSRPFYITCPVILYFTRQDSGAL